jgi:mono/diheme cytochrome c family protein
MKTPTVAIALSVVLAVVIATAIRFDPFTNDQAEAMLRPDDPRVLAAGERIYAEQCASCHGDRLQGQPDWRTRGADGLLPAPPHDAAGHTWHHPDETLFRITKFGVASIVGDPSYKTSMPAYEGRLRDDEIIAVLSWIKAQWPAQVRQKHDQMNAQAAKAARP